MSGEIYPNQQLRLVTLQAAFSGRVAALSRLDQLQDAVGHEFPKLYVPHVSDGEAPALKPYQLRSQDEDELLAVAVNSVTYGARVYPGSARFLDRAIPLIERALATFGVGDLTRVVYRYENEIGIQRVDDALTLDLVIDPQRLEAMCLNAVRTLNLEWVQRHPRGELVTKIYAENDGGVDALHFQITAATIPGGPVSGLLDAARTAHDVAKQRFESMISDAFRKILNDEGAR